MRTESPIENVDERTVNLTPGNAAFSSARICLAARAAGVSSRVIFGSLFVVVSMYLDYGRSVQSSSSFFVP
jgi:hypothetical protein